MFRRRSLFLSAAVLLLAACGGSEDTTDRQRNSALEELCTTAGAVDPQTGIVSLEFCEQAATYTLIVGNERESRILDPIEDGVEINFGIELPGSVELVVRTATTSAFENEEIIGYMGDSFIERVVVSLNDDDTVSIEKVEDRVTSSTCVTINDNETVPFTSTLQLITARITCEGATLVAVQNGEETAALEVEGGRVQYMAPRAEAEYRYAVQSSTEELYEGGIIGLSGTPTRSTLTVTGGTPPSAAGENQGEGATDTTVANEPADTTVPVSSSSSGGSGEMTLEEKWEDCRNAPEFTLDTEEVERTGMLAYSVKWPCLKYMNDEKFEQSVGHSFDNGSPNLMRVSGDALKEKVTGDTYTFSAPVGAGEHSVVIMVNYEGTEYGWYDDSWFDRYFASFTIDSEAAGGFDQCSRSDVNVSKGKLSMDCDKTGALQLRLIKTWDLLESTNGVLDLNVLNDGWEIGNLTVQSGALEFTIHGIFCAKKCDVPANSLKVERTVGEDNRSTFKVTRPTWCTDPLAAWVRGHTYRTIAPGVREEINSEMFWDDPEFSMDIGADASMIRIGADYYFCFNQSGEGQAESVWAEFFLQDDPAETPETTSTSSTQAPTTTVDPGPVSNVPEAVFVGGSGSSQVEIQVPSNSAGLGVSAASIEAILKNANTNVPVVLVTFDTGDRATLRRGRDEVVKVPAGAKSVTFTAYKEDGTKVETTAKIATAKPLVKVSVNGSSSGGSGFPVLPVGAALLVLLAGAAFVVVRRRTGAPGI